MIDSNSPNLDPATRQQLKDIETENRFKALEARPDLSVKLKDLNDRVAELQASVSNLVLEVKALKTKPPGGLERPKGLKRLLK